MKPSNKSEFLNKESYSDFEIRKLQRTANYLYDKNNELEEQLSELKKNQFKTFNDEECWIWQGDGSDNLDTLVCPVVISPRDLSELIKDSLIFKKVKIHSSLTDTGEFMESDSFVGYIDGFK